MREIRTSGSEGGETGQPVFPTPIIDRIPQSCFDRALAGCAPPLSRKRQRKQPSQTGRRNREVRPAPREAACPPKGSLTGSGRCIPFSGSFWNMAQIPENS